MTQRKIETQAAGIFLRAAAYIRTYGWQKEGMSVHGKPRCSMGALASAYRQQKWDNSLAEFMYKALYEELAGISLTQFNYKFESGEKVAQLYERTARKLRQIETPQMRSA
jgi:predicted flavoprotein YhiN